MKLSYWWSDKLSCHLHGCLMRHSSLNLAQKRLEANQLAVLTGIRNAAAANPTQGCCLRICHVRYKQQSINWGWTRLSTGPRVFDQKMRVSVSTMCLYRQNWDKTAKRSWPTDDPVCCPCIHNRRTNARKLLTGPSVGYFGFCYRLLGRPNPHL